MVDECDVVRSHGRYHAGKSPFALSCSGDMFAKANRGLPGLLCRNEPVEFLEPVGDDVDFRTGPSRFRTLQHEEALPVRTDVVLPRLSTPLIMMGARQFRKAG